MQVLTSLLAPFLALVMGSAALVADPLAAARAPGAVLMMRHATAPGTGDPANMRLGDCSTQRNLSDAGREEARAIGALLRDARLEVGQVLASEWCRTTETAMLLDLGPVTPFPPANSFFSNREDADRQSAAVLAYLANVPAEDRVLIVTHQVNITALTGIVPKSGEIVVARRSASGLEVQGRLPPP
ncbi:MAG: histidine phosphatase family protein [Rhodobacterales bacterium]|nr:MAG: histidine phosphatase family protein [Rhodobacterales bacterium]